MPTLIYTYQYPDKGFSYFSMKTQAVGIHSGPWWDISNWYTNYVFEDKYENISDNTFKLKKKGQSTEVISGNLSYLELWAQYLSFTHNDCMYEFA